MLAIEGIGRGLAAPRSRGDGAVTALVSEDTVDGGAADAEPPGDRRGPEPLRLPQPPHLERIDRGFAALVDALGFGGLDPFELPLPAQIGLELGEHAEHVEECLAGSRAGIDRLLGRFEGDAFGAQLVDDVLEVSDRAGEAVDPGDHEGVALVQEVEQELQLGAALAPGTASLLGTDHLAAGGAQLLFLDREVLVEGGHAGVAVEGHGGLNSSCLPLDLVRITS